MAFFDAGGVRLYLGRTEDERFVSRPTIYYRVDDLDTSWTEITARGAKEISGPQLVHRDGVTELWMAFVADPDDIPVGLMEERPESTRPRRPPTDQGMRRSGPSTCVANVVDSHGTRGADRSADREGGAEQDAVEQQHAAGHLEHWHEIAATRATLEHQPGTPRGRHAP